MKLRIAFAMVLALTLCQLGWSHQDRIIRLNGETLEGLPPQYQRASFSLSARRLTVASSSVEIPDCVWKRFGRVTPTAFRFHASWYHDPSILPPYINILVAESGTKNRYELLLNLDTLAIISLTKVFVEEDGSVREEIPIESSCASSWKIIRKE